MRKLLFLQLLVCLSFWMGGCSFYRQDIMFRVDRPESKTYIKSQVEGLKANYRIRINDRVEFRVYTNNGELLIDPNRQLARQLMGSGGGSMNQMNMGVQSNVTQGYLVLGNGLAYLPMLGYVNLVDLTIRQVDSTLAVKYGAFYNDCYVNSKVMNRRIFVFAPTTGGAQATSGISGQVLELDNENTSLVEVLARASSIPPFTQVGRVRIIRGDLTNPSVYVVNMRFIHTMAKQSIIIQPYDVIYVEPGRRPFFDVLRDVTYLGGLATSILTLILVLSLKK